MKNKIPKLVYLAILIVILAAPLWPNMVSAQTVLKTGFEDICPKNIGIGGCIVQIYLFSLGAGAVIALFMVVLAGYRYMTAGGNADQVSKAKDTLQSSFTGLIIIFVGFVLLYFINPDLVVFQDINRPGYLEELEFDNDGNFIPGGNTPSSVTQISGISVSGNVGTYILGEQVLIGFSPLPASLSASTFTWTIAGIIPNGLNFNQVNQSINGTVASSAAFGTYTIDIRASSPNNGSTLTTFSFTIKP